ncbi:MAG: T9SS type A sorting domain-containing protein [Bacteroidetes bacterium]|nr:T9SS type A sorting domain-containing protein [Bacteroidota bacterium]MBK7108556.1 T9SS type A sorting domain-containing protein [Bacteroidota bacterium]
MKTCISLFTIYSTLGNKIKEGILNGNEIDVANLPSGSYSIKLTTHTDLITLQFIKL